MTNASPEATAINTFAKSKKAMDRARKAIIVSTNDNISVIADKFVAGDEYPPLPQSAFVGAAKVPNRRRRGPREHVALIFAEDGLVEDSIRGGTTSIFVDATFRITPRQARAVGDRGAQVISTVCS